MPRTFDEVRVAPPARELVKLLERAERNANSRLKERRLEHDRAFWETFVRRSSKKREGVRDYSGGRGGTPAANVRVAWWTDHLGRQHWRVVGRRRDWSDYRPPHPSANLPLVRLFPEHVVLHERGKEADVLLTCPMCGMAGTVGALAWTGPRCGPCHDRLEEGDVSPPVTAFPVLTGHHEMQIRHLAFPSDGRTLVSSDLSDRTFRWRLDTGEAKRLYRPSSSWMVPLAIGPDGTVARMTYGTRTLKVFGPEGEERSVKLPRGYAQGVAFSPSGRWLALFGQPTWLIDLTREELQPEVRSEGHFSVGTFLDERRLCLFAGHNCILHDLDTGDQETVPVPSQVTGPVEDDEFWEEDFFDDFDYWDLQLAASPDGQWVALTTYGQQPLHLCHVPTRKWSAHRLPHPVEDDLPRLLFAPDGALVVVADESLSVWDMARREPRTTLRVAWETKGWVSAAALSPDGETLALGRHDGRIELRPWKRWLEAR